MSSSSTVYDQIDLLVAHVNFFIMLFGIAGNSICLCVFSRKSLLARRFNWYLLCLAGADLLFSIITFINYAIIFNNPSRAIFDLNWLTCHLIDYVIATLDAFCVFLTLILTIDRLYAIVKPLKIKQFVTHMYPRRLSLACLLVFMLLLLPEIFLSQRKYITKSTNQTILTQSDYSEPTMDDFDSSINQTAYQFSEIFSVLRDRNNQTSLESLRAKLESQLENSSEMSSSTISSVTMNTSDVDVEEADSYYEDDTCIYITSLDEIYSLSKAFAQHHNELRMIYIVYCKIVMSILLNVLPALTILGLNVTLLFFVRSYYSTRTNLRSPLTAKNSIQMTQQPLIQQTTQATQQQQQNNLSTMMNKNQKSYFLTIIVMSVWLLLTSVPYYALCTYYWVVGLRVVDSTMTSIRVHMTIQAISSAFFNLNHCTNIFIYLIFHRNFRYKLFELFTGCFNVINPVFKINPFYYSHGDSQKRKRNNSHVNNHNNQLNAHTERRESHMSQMGPAVSSSCKSLQPKRSSSDLNMNTGSLIPVQNRNNEEKTSSGGAIDHHHTNRETSALFLSRESYNRLKTFQVINHKRKPVVS